MIEPINVKRADVAVVVNATFPDYRGRKFRIYAQSSVTFHDLNWSGGTRSQYRACSYAGARLGSMDRFNQRAPWDNPAEGSTVEIPQGACIVEHTIFCGKDSGLRIYVNPADMPRLLPAPQA